MTSYKRLLRDFFLTYDKLQQVTSLLFFNLWQVTKCYFATLFVTSQVTTGYAATVLKTVVDVNKTTVTETRENINFVTNKL